mmetsp:Transcript_134549/g.339844  ORF Transcript_134549/g.339844 Transcript_134549/m.339844 type:complete len:388 (+) Transcript_134549:102-1265(+)
MDPEVLSKKGADLFKELLRRYPTADIEDYHKAGTWREDILKIDLQLVEAHRKESGAPDPIPLEEVEMPALPVQLVPTAAGIPSLGGPRPPATMMGGIRPVVTTTAGVRPFVTTTAGATAAGSPVSELRLIALFVAKWKLDPTRAKMVLFKLPSAKRRFVLDNFKAVAGTDTTAGLEQYVAKCASTNAWGAAAVAATPLGTAAALAPRPGVASTGLKRPLSTIVATAAEAAKRPRLGMTPTGPTIQNPALQARLAAVGNAAGPASRPAASFARPLLSARGPSAPRPGMLAAARPAMGGAQRPGSMAVRPTPLLSSSMARPPGAALAAAAATRPSGGLLAVAGARPVTMVAAQSRPGVAAARPAGMMAPRAKVAAAKPGGLIADLLKRY